METLGARVVTLANQVSTRGQPIEFCAQSHVLPWLSGFEQKRDW